MRKNLLGLCVVTLGVSIAGAGANMNERGNSEFGRVEPGSAFQSAFIASDPVPTAQAGKTDDLLVDETAKAALAGLWSAVEKARTNHFFAYFVAVCLVCGSLLGVGIASVAYITAAPHCKFMEKCHRTTALAAAAGAGLGVVLATTTSVPAHGKLTYLLLGLLLSTISTTVGCYLTFIAGRRIQVMKASKMGMRLDPERMKIF